MRDLAQIEKVLFLKEVPLFQFCSASEILGIAAIAKQQSFRGGEVIYEGNSPAATLYCVVEGRVNLERDEAVAVEAGRAFGYQEILSGRMRPGRAVAQGDCLTLAIDAEDFFDLLANNIEIVKALFRQLADGPLGFGGTGGPGRARQTPGV